MIAYCIRRFGQGLVVVIAVSFITFFEAHLLPGNPARAILGVHASSAQIAAFNRENGYNQSLAVQYADYINHLIHGNLGFSYQDNQTVAALLGERLGPTVVLVGLSVVVALIAAVPLAAVQAVRRNKPVDYALTSASLTFYSMPTFWLGLVLLQVFSFELRLFPARGDGLDGLVLPAVTLAVPASAFVAQVLSVRLLAEMRQPYVDTARAKGASRARVVSVHALRNAAMPALTMVALLVGWLLSGSVVVETVFARNGLGRLVESAVTTRDLPVLQGLVVVTTALVTLLALAVDLLHPLVDPRERA
jgi:peptide/nickel transport system permease protein